MRRLLKPFVLHYLLLYPHWVYVTAVCQVDGFQLIVHQNEEMNHLLAKLIKHNWRVISIRRRDTLQWVCLEAMPFATRIPHRYGQNRRHDEPMHLVAIKI
ncbi:hypothetical protein [Chloroflexus islandicus]|uniref:hypothetical protein n=1 Tax=Chloroflexus islandicus TaxID=1707952 RepID=UPI0015602C2A|nr:hypothetical protein [Chloroflexus islandicus]